ncbi:F-box domain-containing protein [Mycena indigotica]|uniref:F-box domain-containing protein n=1 Tax=Mycena indigotica TaxID=2126181 RepID=A0A8H6TF68_9AGAR|nr:F-box domain-containing protein [Mycena indigotica]KAF7316144.1 F-box domain-containing protein [Mycena indigotica]
MFSARRSLRQLASTSARLSLRQLAVAPLLPRTALQATRSFSATSRALKAGSSDISLSQKLSEELKYEKEAEEGQEPEFVRDFASQGIWQIKDTPGDNEIVLTRQFGNESIRLVFSVADLQNQEPNEFDEEAGEERPEEEEQQQDIMRAVLTITKSPTSGALEVDMTAQNGQFLVENVTFYPDTKLGQDTSVDADWKRRGLYLGPEFSTLDVTLQEEFEKYLAERDIGESLALFIPDYAHHKEQKEYVRWLSNVQKFVDI